MSVKRPHKDHSAPLAHFVSRVCLYYTSFEIHSTQTRVKNKTKHVWSLNFVGLANIMCDEQLKLQNTVWGQKRQFLKLGFIKTALFWHNVCLIPAFYFMPYFGLMTIVDYRWL